MDWNHMPFYGLNPTCGPADKPAAKPQNFEAMKEFARHLSAQFPFARVDMYAANDKTYFGEITFYPASGYGCFTPDEWDQKLGDLFSLSSQKGECVLGGGKWLIISDDTPYYVSRGLIDYKFFCFNGKVAYVYGISDRQVGVSAQIGIYDRNFHKLEVSRLDERPQDEALPKPENYEQMVAYAEQLSAQFPEVRVDLYNVSGKIYFGEMTFYDGSGYMTFNPDSFDFEMGEKFDVSSFQE